MRKIKPYNSGTMTKAAFMQRIRSHMRRCFMYWYPLKEAKNAARRKNQSENKRMKWEYQCAHCKQWYKGDDVQVDHVTPVGSLKDLRDLPIFVKKLAAEGVESYQVLCKPCHKVVTAEERAAPVTAAHWYERIQYYEEAISYCERELRELNNKAQQKEKK